MTLDDVLLTARLVVDGRVHCVTDESVKAMAQALLDAHWKPVAHEDSPTLVESPKLEWRHNAFNDGFYLHVDGSLLGCVEPDTLGWCWRTLGGPMASGIAATREAAQADCEAALAQSHTTERD